MFVTLAGVLRRSEFNGLRVTDENDEKLLGPSITLVFAVIILRLNTFKLLVK